MGAAARQQTKWSTILRPSTRDNQFWLKGADYEAARVPECGAAASLLPTLTLNLSPEPGAVSGLGVMVWTIRQDAVSHSRPSPVPVFWARARHRWSETVRRGSESRERSLPQWRQWECVVLWLVTTELLLSTSISTRVAGPSKGTCSNPA